MVTAESWALFFHLLGAFLFVGGAILAGAAYEVARTRQRPDEIVLLLGLSRVGALFVGAGALLILPFGLWLVDLEGLGYDTEWVVAAIALFALAFAAGFVAGQAPKRARPLAGHRARPAPNDSRDLRRLLDDRVSRGLSYVAALLVLAIIALMVFKPG